MDQQWLRLFKWIQSVQWSHGFFALGRPVPNRALVSQWPAVAQNWRVW